MRVIEPMKRTGLDAATAGLLMLALVLAMLHHADHVLRVDHSGWPFRSVVTPFTFSLLAYPVVLFALFGPRRLFRWRWLLLAVATAFTLFAHTTLESPPMQYAMWANDRSLDPHAAGLHNLPGIRSPLMGVVSVAVAMALNVTAVLATLAMLAGGVHRRREARRRI